jgi:hypothetical protein
MLKEALTEVDLTATETHSKARGLDRRLGKLELLQKRVLFFLSPNLLVLCLS